MYCANYLGRPVKRFIDTNKIQCHKNSQTIYINIINIKERTRAIDTDRRKWYFLKKSLRYLAWFYLILHWYPITRCSERTLIERPMQIALLSLACSFSFTPFASATLLLFFFKLRKVGAIWRCKRLMTEQKEERKREREPALFFTRISKYALKASKLINLILVQDYFPQNFIFLRKCSGSRDLKINRAKESFQSWSFVL